MDPRLKHSGAGRALAGARAGRGWEMGLGLLCRDPLAANVSLPGDGSSLRHGWGWTLLLVPV